MPVLFHATEEGGRQFHVEMGRLYCRPSSLLIAVLLGYLPTAESNNQTVCFRVFHDECAVCGIVQAKDECFMPPLTPESIVWEEMLQSLARQGCST
jgi:hypothetical protein